MRRRLVDAVLPGARAKVNQFLFAAAAAGRLGGELLDGEWHNLGTPQQLAALNGAAG
jgi:MurNAc alpha-1-phosphate uridylyltransferase